MINQAETYERLYSLDANGAKRVWYVEREGSRYRVRSGLDGGKISETGWRTAKGKNPGKKNATSDEEQAHKEVLALYQRKQERKYSDDSESASRHKFFAPMLAEKYKGWTGPVFTQPKLDGIRCLAKADGLWSRAGKPIVAVPHVWEGIKDLFEEDPDLVLDGELYNHDLRDDFNTITSVVRKKSPTPEELEAARIIQYHVYDCPSEVGEFSSRYDQLIPLGGREHLMVVDTRRATTVDELDSIYGSYMAEGYEGQMVRLDGFPYEVGSRSKSLLKRKQFDTEEFELDRVEEGNGNWAGYAKRAYLRTKDGVSFKAGLRGDQSFTRKLLQDWRRYGSATVRFQGLTPGDPASGVPEGVPRFGVVIDWHEGDRQD